MMAHMVATLMTMVQSLGNYSGADLGQEVQAASRSVAPFMTPDGVYFLFFSFSD